MRDFLTLDNDHANGRFAYSDVSQFSLNKPTGRFIIYNYIYFEN